MLSNIKNAITKVTGNTGLLIKKHSPEILVGVGIVSIVSGTVMACKATLKVDEVLDEAKENLDKCKAIKEDETFKQDYTEEDYTKDVALVYMQTGIKFVKMYAPAVMLTIGGIGCIVGSHYILKKRNIALMAAYKTVEEGYKSYRKRVSNKFGEEVERKLHLGIEEETITEVEEDENGKKKKVKKVVDKYTDEPSMYARFFDEASPYWKNTPELNLTFLRAQQNYANDLLKSRGHVFLNEVYDMLGIQRTQAGQIVGWVLGGDGNDYIDFGIYDITREKARDFVNGYEQSILLDFNVDGVIYDMI